MTIDLLLLSGIAHARSGGDLIVMREAAGGPAVGGPGAQRGRSAVAGREVEPWQPAQGAVRPGCVVVEQVFRQYPAQMMLAGDQQSAGELAAHCADHRAQTAFPVGACGGLRTMLLPATVKTAPQESVNCSARSLTRNLTQAARRPGSTRKVRAAAGLPSRTTGRRPVPPWSGECARMLGFDGGTPRPCPCIKAVGTEAADSATLPRVLRLPRVNVADLAFKSVAR